MSQYPEIFQCGLCDITSEEVTDFTYAGYQGYTPTVMCWDCVNKQVDTVEDFLTYGLIAVRSLQEERLLNGAMSEEEIEKYGIANELMGDSIAEMNGEYEDG